MATYSIFEVRNYLMENKPFFQNLFSLDSNESHLRQYVDDLRVLLYKHRRRLTEDSSTAVIYKWKEGDFEPALCFEEIRKFIIENKKHIEFYLPVKSVVNPPQRNAQLFNEPVVQQHPKSELNFQLSQFSSRAAFRDAAFNNQLQSIRNLYQDGHRFNWEENHDWLLTGNNRATRYLRFLMLSDEPSSEQIGIMRGYRAATSNPEVKHDLTFVLSLNDIKLKSEDLYRRQHNTAARKAELLYDGIKKSVNKFYCGELSLSLFKRECSELIQDASTDLKHHRGLLGIIDYLVKIMNQIVGNNNFFSRPQTHSSSLLNKLEDTIEQHRASIFS